METVYIEYSHLRRACEQVLMYAKEYAPELDAGMRTSLSADMGLADLDAHDFLQGFEQWFGLKLPEEVHCSFWDKDISIVAKILYIPAFILFLPFMAFAVLLLPLLPTETTKQKKRRNIRRITLGDLATRLAIGHYVKREKIQIRLKHASSRHP